MYNHKHKVNETKTRSFLKSISGRLIEITIGTLIIGTILTVLKVDSPYKLGFMMTIVEETLCFIICYFNDRIWNKINWGRNVKDVECQLPSLSKKQLKKISDEMELWDKTSDEDWIKFAEENDL